MARERSNNKVTKYNKYIGKSKTINILERAKPGKMYTIKMFSNDS